jgi:hypothetical protein
MRQESGFCSAGVSPALFLAGGAEPGLWMAGVKLLVRAEDSQRAAEILGPRSKV